MDIQQNNNNNNYKGDIYISEEVHTEEERREHELEEMYEEELANEENPSAKAIKEKYDVLFSWRGMEYEHYDVNPRFKLVAIIFLSAVILYSLVTNNPIVAITFILIGISGYLYIQKEPREIEFAVTTEGVIVGNQLYEFENMKSFWIFYEPPVTKTISLRMKDSVFPFIHVPIHEENPVKIRSILLEYVPERKQEPTFVDAFERLIHY